MELIISTAPAFDIVRRVNDLIPAALRSTRDGKNAYTETPSARCAPVSTIKLSREVLEEEEEV